jgi:hypothetical protein
LSSSASVIELVPRLVGVDAALEGVAWASMVTTTVEALFSLTSRRRKVDLNLALSVLVLPRSIASLQIAKT